MIFCTQLDLSVMFGISPARVSQLVSEGVLPKPLARGKYQVVDFVKAYLAHIKGTDAEKEFERRREALILEREELKVEAMRRDAAIKDNQLVNFEGVMAVQAEAMNVVSSQVQFMGSVIVDKLKLDAEQADRIEQVIRDLMRSTAEKFEVMATDLG